MICTDLSLQADAHCSRFAVLVLSSKQCFRDALKPKVSKLVNMAAGGSAQQLVALGVQPPATSPQLTPADRAEVQFCGIRLIWVLTKKEQGWIGDQVGGRNSPFPWIFFYFLDLRTAYHCGGSEKDLER